MSCERRRAHAIPAGPPPTMTTSAGICGRSTPSMGLRKISIGGYETSFARRSHIFALVLSVLRTRPDSEVEELFFYRFQLQLCSQVIPQNQQQVIQRTGPFPH